MLAGNGDSATLNFCWVLLAKADNLFTSSTRNSYINIYIIKLIKLQ